MATWNNNNRNSASFSNSSRNSASFSNLSKSDTGMTFGDLTNDIIGNYSNDDVFQGRPIGDWRNNDVISGTIWSLNTRN